MKNEIILFTDGDINIEVQINPEQETVWLTQKQMEELFDVKHATISEHITKILTSGELDETSVGFSDKSSGGREPKIYNLDVLRAVNEYTEALLLLDQYYHQTLCKPDGSSPIYRITYEECVQMVGKMRDSFHTDVFRVEKEVGKVSGIIAAVYQSVFGQKAYPSVEEKAANLLNL